MPANSGRGSGECRSTPPGPRWPLRGHRTPSPGRPTTGKQPCCPRLDSAPDPAQKCRRVPTAAARSDDASRPRERIGHDIDTARPSRRVEAAAQLQGQDGVGPRTTPIPDGPCWSRPGSRLRLGSQAREEAHEVQDVLVRERLGGDRHGAVYSWKRSRPGTSRKSSALRVHSMAPLVKAQAATARSNSRCRPRGTDRYRSAAMAASRGPKG
jgi:hypothetical protein